LVRNVLGILLAAVVKEPSQVGVRSTRRRVLELIEARPGISIREIARRLETTWPNAKYHASRLQASGQINTRVLGRHRVCFPTSIADSMVVEARALLAEPTARRVAVFVTHHPGGGVQDVVRGTQLSQRVVYYHLKRLLEAGLVEHSNESRYGGLRPSATLFHALN